MSDVQSQLCTENIILKPLSESDFTTRYRGSKKKLVNWIWNQIKDFEFETVLDAFGGTGSIAYKAKKEGKTVIYNDYLKYNYYIGKGLIENNSEILTEEDIIFIFSRHDFDYPTFIQDNFKETYYTNEENKWLDQVVTNIFKMRNEYKKSLALYCLFQSCIIKRPYNLFHRKNLYVRTSDVKRSFGNKVTWDKSFEEHFRKFIKEINSCVFPTNKKCLSINHDVFKIPEEEKYDLVYIDTPYIPKKGEIVDYRDAYHFLEGLVNYSNWEELIDRDRKHKPLKKEYCVWNDKNNIINAFEKLIEKFKNSILVISYRSDGIPSKKELLNILKKHKQNVKEIKAKDFKYVLSKKNSQELLFVAY